VANIYIYIYKEL